MSSITEIHVEEAALAWLTELGYGVKAGPEIAPDSSAPERPSYGDVVLAGRLARAVERLNPAIPMRRAPMRCGGLDRSSIRD
jgi:type I restriction enzyme R subunit